MRCRRQLTCQWRATQALKKKTDVSRLSKGYRVGLEGCYVEGYAEGVPVVFTADTGATKTIISKYVFKRINSRDQPKLRGSVSLVGPNAVPIKELGMGVLGLEVGPVTLEREAVVADIEDDVLLGYDVLGSKDNGPVDILLSRNVLVLNGVEITCVRDETARKVWVADDVTVPGGTEAVIDVFVERQEGDDKRVGDFVVESTKSLDDTHQLLMAATLVNLNTNPTCRVCVLNPFSKEVILRQNTFVGKAEKVENIVAIVAEAESGNVERVSIRRVYVSAEAAVSEAYEEADEKEVPDHLIDMYKRSTEGKDIKQK
ncbi:hypothetical protein DPMN_168047 [Dreissena polymorpha]|uniref:Peptidase A2 domain-containing protein n=1 Tax=Dreissena polymorpha TaxID=45954 RepID=A0A9D4IZA5_DREPO|nr:hypothetical protein DPMN_168047 [Dreissena polymorpha]